MAKSETRIVLEKIAARSGNTMVYINSVAESLVSLGLFRSRLEALEHLASLYD